MRLLLDTHVVLWALADDARLGAAPRQHITDGRNAVFVSAVTGWEVTIKQALGKIQLPDDLVAQLAAARFEDLPVTMDHALAVAALADHHRDPFDRMLVAQARIEGLTLVTADRQLGRYDVEILSVQSSS